MIEYYRLLVPGLSLLDLLEAAFRHYCVDGVLYEKDFLKIIEIIASKRCDDENFCIHEDWLGYVANQFRKFLSLEPNETNSVTIEELMTPRLESLLSIAGVRSPYYALNVLAGEIAGDDSEGPFDKIDIFAEKLGITTKERAHDWHKSLKGSC